MYYAHSGNAGDKSDWQPLPEHLQETAALAAVFAAPFGLERLAYTTALFHDLGKYDPRFQERLTGVNIRVDHSTAGAFVLRDLAKEQDRYSRIMAELAAYVILGHHAGLPDRHNAEPSCFNRRIGNFTDRLDPVWMKEVAFDLAGIVPDWLPPMIRPDNPHLAFDLSVVARMLFSCLVDADFKNTEKFYTALENREADRKWPALQDLLPEFRTRFDAHMAGLNRDGDLNALRRDILAHVRGKAAMAPGLFTLTVPTGGGKTLVSFGFALDHAAVHGHRRIIYVIPFTSITEQTVDVFGNVVGKEYILEHHSAIDEEHPDRKAWLTSRDKLKLAMEDWAAPVVVTTNVQFFESLFAARTSRARKLHNIAGSIIILDEAQTIPRPLLKPCVRMLDALAKYFGCTIILCTATQPALGREAPDGGTGFPDGLDLAGRELAPDPEALARRLRRACIVQGGAMDNDTLVAALADESQALVIVNSRRHALELYRQAKQAGLDGLVHLTTRQCAAHRRKILETVREDLKNKRPCRVIATSLIEAGVDVDFPKVWRAEAGWDQVMRGGADRNLPSNDPCKTRHKSLPSRGRGSKRAVEMPPDRVAFARQTAICPLQLAPWAGFRYICLLVIRVRKESVALATATALWITGPGMTELQPVSLSNDPIEIETLYSGISRGTEALVFAGEVPQSEWTRMRCPLQEGDFPFPVKYGYAAVGKVLRGAPASDARTVFVLHPHQDRFTAPEAMAIPLPDGVPPQRAVLAANMETALNIVWDAGATPGDRIAIVGTGVVGALVGSLCAALPGSETTLVDVDRSRSILAAAFGCDFATPDRCPDECDLVIHASGTAEGLETALAAAGTEARVVEASWYGTHVVKAHLGQAFHSRRLSLVSSQVGAVPPKRRARWTRRRRLETALLLLRDDRYDALISGETAFADLPAEYGRILAGPSTLCHRVRY